MYIASKCLFGPAEVPGAAELNAAELKRIREAYSLRRADRYTALVVGAAVRAAQASAVSAASAAVAFPAGLRIYSRTYSAVLQVQDAAITPRNRAVILGLIWS